MEITVRIMNFSSTTVHLECILAPFVAFFWDPIEPLDAETVERESD